MEDIINILMCQKIFMNLFYHLIQKARILINALKTFINIKKFNFNSVFYLKIGLRKMIKREKSDVAIICDFCGDKVIKKITGLDVLRMNAKLPEGWYF